MADPVVERPTPEDVRDYLGAQAGGPIDMSEVEKSLDAARQRIYERTLPYPSQGQPPEVMVRAITMYAARLYRRRFSTSGYEGFGEVGIARVTTLDPDIEELLIRLLRDDFA